jgi:hypothetical protein
LLSPERLPKQRDMLGKTWVGNLRVELDGLSAADRKIALDAMRRVLDDYGQRMGTESMRPGVFGNLGTSTGGERTEEESSIGSGASPAAVNAANKDYWDKIGQRYSNRDAAKLSAPGTIKSIQTANETYWANQPKFRGGRFG